jgi:hypothetical membrane protein
MTDQNYLIMIFLINGDLASWYFSAENYDWPKNSLSDLGSCENNV